METSLFVWFILFFISSSTAQGQVFKVYDQQKLIDSVKYYGLARVARKDSTRLYKIGTNEVKQFQAFIQKTERGCHSSSTMKETHEKLLKWQLKIGRIERLIKDISSYRDSISEHLAIQYLEKYKKKDPVQIIEKGSIIYQKKPIIDVSENLVAFMRDKRVFVSIIQQYNQWLITRTGYYALDEIFNDLRE